MTILSRRSFGHLACGAAGSLIAGQSAAMAGSAPGQQAFEDMLRAMGRIDGGIAYRWTHGILSGVVDQQTTQLMGVSQQIVSRHVPQIDGQFKAVYLELVYFTDLNSGAVLETWDNPYLGKQVRVPVSVLGPTKFAIGPSLEVINAPFPLEGLKHRHWLEPSALETGDDLMFNERLDSYVPAMTPGGAPLIFHEVFSFRAGRAALRASQAPHVPATVDKFNIISWRPWMEMGDHPGVTVARGAGRVTASYEALPPDLIEKNERYFPEVVADLRSYLEV